MLLFKTTRIVFGIQRRGEWSMIFTSLLPGTIRLMRQYEVRHCCFQVAGKILNG
jgi:hypothetical protein